MTTNARVRLWLESVLALTAGALAVLTLAWRDWIEEVFGVDPDGGDGTVEWIVTAALFVLAVALLVVARREWRRLRTAAVRA